MEKEEILQFIKGGLIVSCQALENEPLHSSFIMSKMAYAAMLGGAVGIRANSGNDIKAIKETVDLPIIGLSKVVYKNSPVFITPTIKEVQEVIEAGADIVAIDATDRPRPDGLTLKQFVNDIKKQFPNIVLMGDISKLTEGIECEKLGFDLISTTLSGYTEDTEGKSLPDFTLMKELNYNLSTPIIAEGGIWTTEDLKRAFNMGVYATVIGSAITRPMEITKRFVNIIKNYNKN